MSLARVLKDYEYEVAFSFLAQDESLAYQISDKLQERLITFVYSELDKQAKVVGANGVDFYKSVFKEKARIAVILYREGYGVNGWTKIESDAIRERAFDEGHEFIVLLSLDKQRPQWYPKIFIWDDFERFGVAGAQVFIESAVKRYGGEIHEETIADQTARHKREAERKKFLKDYFFSQQAFSDGRSEAKKFLQLVEESVAVMTDKQNGITYSVTTHQDQITLQFGNHFLEFAWMETSNVLAGAYMIGFMYSLGDYEYQSMNRKVTKLNEVHFKFYINEANTFGWTNRNGSPGFITTERLVTEWLMQFAEHAKKIRDRIESQNGRHY